MSDEYDILEISTSSGKLEELEGLFDSSSEKESIDVPIGGGLARIQRQMELAKKKEKKEREEILVDILPQKLISGNRFRINDNLVLEARKDLIAAAAQVRGGNPRESEDPFWLLDNIIPFRRMFRQGPRRMRTDREIARMIKRAQDDIQKLQNGQLKKGRKILRKKKFGDLTLLYWPVEPELGVEEEIVVKREFKPIQFVQFQNFDIPPPPLSSKINPWENKPIAKMMDVKGAKVTLGSPVPDDLRKIVRERLFSVLSDVKGLNADEIVSQVKVESSSNKNDFIREKVQELREKGEIDVIGDEVGQKIVQDYIHVPDTTLRTEMIAYHIKRRNPNVFTKDTIYRAQMDPEEQKHIQGLMENEIRTAISFKRVELGPHVEKIVNDKKLFAQWRKHANCPQYNIKDETNYQKKMEMVRSVRNCVVEAIVQPYIDEIRQHIQMKYYQMYPFLFAAQEYPIISQGLFPLLGDGVISEAIFKELSQCPCDSNYGYIQQLGISPTITDEFGQPRQILDGSGIEVELFDAIRRVVEGNEFTESELKEYFVGWEQERVSQEQWDVINRDWEEIQEIEPSDSLSVQSIEDVYTQIGTLKNEVVALEEGLYNSSSTIREYVLKSSVLITILELNTANNLRTRINSGRVAVENLWMLPKEELFPEIFLNDNLIEEVQIGQVVEKDGKQVEEIVVKKRDAGLRFQKWFDNKVFEEANVILSMWKPQIRKEWFQIVRLPFGFEPENHVISEEKLCDKQGKFYVMTADGIKCMTASQVRKNLKKLKKYNRKDLEKMIEE